MEEGCGGCCLRVKPMQHGLDESCCGLFLGTGLLAAVLSCWESAEVAAPVWLSSGGGYVVGRWRKVRALVLNCGVLWAWGFECLHWLRRRWEDGSHGQRCGHGHGMVELIGKEVGCPRVCW